MLPDGAALVAKGRITAVYEHLLFAHAQPLLQYVHIFPHQGQIRLAPVELLPDQGLAGVKGQHPAPVVSAMAFATFRLLSSMVYTTGMSS